MGGRGPWPFGVDPPGIPGNLDREEHPYAHFVSPIHKLFKAGRMAPAGKALATEAWCATLWL